MTLRGLKSWILLTACLLSLSAGTVSGPSVAAAATNDTARVVQLINQQRAQRGLPALAVNTALTNAAQGHADDMARYNYFSHTGRNGSTMVTRVQAAGYTNWRYLSENIAAGYTTPEQVVNAWMNSSGHRANILSTSGKEIGVGKGYNAASTYKNYWVADFGARS
jgi:uncharacterized protein YkwD